jgi:class 3 adenylate cyclase
MAELPTGTVTFLFTDIEGSTRLLEELGDRYAEVLSEAEPGTELAADLLQLLFRVGLEGQLSLFDDAVDLTERCAANASLRTRRARPSVRTVSSSLSIEQAVAEALRA